MKLKKTIALLLSCVMMITTAIPANFIFADENTPTVLQVGTDKDYKTINDALYKIKDGTIPMPTKESERIYINVDPGVYEEQVKFTKGMKYITLRQTPDTEGLVRLSWYYCTGYAYSNCDLSGNYNPNVDWYNPGTWYGYDDVDENGNVIGNSQEDFPVYKIGNNVSGTISYYDKNNEKQTVTVRGTQTLGGNFNLDAMAAVIAQNGSTDITIEDLHVVNSVPVMVTQGEKDAHITPNGLNGVGAAIPARDNLAICDEDTPEIVVKNIDQTTEYNAGQSAYIVRSSKYNERGHALSLNGDRIICRNVYARGNQDSVYISTGRIYFENCNLIGGTDYIYGNAAAVFNNCKLGFEGMSDKEYGGPITAANTDFDNPYGYLFYNCQIYNVRENAGVSNYGRPWGANAQITFYKTVIDDKGIIGKSPFKLNEGGWTDMSVKKDEARFYEYGTTNNSGKAVDFSKRVVNTLAGMGTVLDDWQILEFNPRNYFKARKYSNNKLGFDENWDPMGFASNLTEIDKQLDAVNLNIPAGEETVISLPQSSDSNIEFKYLSSSTNAVVSEDGKNVTVVRPAVGEKAIETTITLYAKDKTTGFGDKKVIPVTINATTNTTDVFNIPVTVKTSIATDVDTNYDITITKEDALIKSQRVTVPANATSATATIENVPANEKGIEYNVQVVSESDEFTVIRPAEGKTIITGVKGNNVNLEIIAQKIIDETVTTKANFKEGTASFASYDLISLAKEMGASDQIDTSDIVTVDFDLNISSALKSTSYIDLTSKTPTSNCSTGGENSRFTLFRLNSSWTQLDSVDCVTGFSGVSNTENQWLNVVGKFDYSTPNHVSITINYKTKTITAKGTGSGKSQSVKEYTFAGFPTDYEKGKINLAVYPASADTFSINNISVTYKEVVSEDNDSKFSIPVTIEASDVAEIDSEYQINIIKNSKVIKTQKITMPAGEKTTTGVVSGIPASELGAEYDVEVASLNPDFAVTTPKNGVTKVIGYPDTDVPLKIVASKTFDVSFDTGAEFKEGTADVTNFDLIALAKANGASDQVEKSDIITVDFDLDLSEALKNEGTYMDLTSKDPGSKCNTKADSSRFALFRVYKNWNQLDMVDCTTSLSGTKDSENQFLNVVGKFDYKTTSHVSVTINYKTKVMSITADGSGNYQKLKEYTFGGFPTNCEKGKLNLTIYPAGADTFSVKNIKVSYKDVLLTDDDENAFNIPVTINADNAVDVDTEYQIDVKKGNSVIKTQKITMPAGQKTATDTLYDLPASKTGITYDVEIVSLSEYFNIVTPADGKTTVIGIKDTDAPIVVSVKKVVFFNIPVTINATDVDTNDAQFLVNVKKDNEIIKTKTITMSAGQKTATDVISGLPASEKGTSYDIEIISLSEYFNISTPKDGKTTVTGIIGTESVPVAVSAKKVVDKVIKTGAEFKEGTAEFTNYDLIALAKANGADDEIEKSNVITVDFDFDVSGALKNGTSYFELTSKTPTASCNTGADNARFALFRLYSNWNQLDMVDCTNGFSGVTNSENQWLNIAGNFDYSTTSHITVTLNYNTKTMTVKANGSNALREYKFAGFPTNFEKGKLNFAIYLNSADTFSIKNVNITYKVNPNNTNKEPAVTAKVENGNTVVTLENINEGIVIAVKYNNGKFVDMKTLDVTNNNVTFENFEANSIFVWNSILDMKPITKAYNIK